MNRVGRGKKIRRSDGVRCATSNILPPVIRTSVINPHTSHSRLYIIVLPRRVRNLFSPSDRNYRTPVSSRLSFRSRHSSRSVWSVPNARATLGPPRRCSVLAFPRATGAPCVYRAPSAGPDRVSPFAYYSPSAAYALTPLSPQARYVNKKFHFRRGAGPRGVRTRRRWRRWRRRWLRRAGTTCSPVYNDPSTASAADGKTHAGTSLLSYIFRRVDSENRRRCNGFANASDRHRSPFTTGDGFSRSSGAIGDRQLVDGRKGWVYCGFSIIIFRELVHPTSLEMHSFI